MHIHIYINAIPRHAGIQMDLTRLLSFKRLVATLIGKSANRRGSPNDVPVRCYLSMDSTWLPRCLCEGPAGPRLSLQARCTESGVGTCSGF